MSLEEIMVSKISQGQKDKYCIVSRMKSYLKKMLYSQNSECLVLAKEYKTVDGRH